MKCLNCGGIAVIWRPDVESLWCMDCKCEPRGHEPELEPMDNLPEEVPIEVIS